MRLNEMLSNVVKLKDERRIRAGRGVAEAYNRQDG